MKIKYNINEKQQRELASMGKEAHKDRTGIIEDDRLVSDIIRDHKLVEINRQGSCMIDLTKNIIATIEAENLFNDGTGAAKGNVCRRNFTIQSAPASVGGWFLTFECDHLIDSPQSLRRALNEIDKINESKYQEAGRKTAEEIEAFPRRVEAYNKKYAERRLKELQEKVSKLIESNAKLRYEADQTPQVFTQEYSERILKENSELREEVTKLAKQNAELCDVIDHHGDNK